MEKQIFLGIQERLQAQAAFLQDNNQPPIEHYDWWANQVDVALEAEAENNTGIAWPRPAVFVEFGETEGRSNGLHTSFSGTVTLHVVQDRSGVNSEAGAANQDNFLQQLDYLSYLQLVIESDKLPCSARLVFASQQRDHTNRPLMHEQLRFNWNAVIKRQAV